MGFETYKPTIVMIALQFMYAAITLCTRVTLVEGLSARVFVVYRQTIAFLLIAPIAFRPRRKTGNSICLGWKSFWLIFLAALIGVTINQNIYFSGLYYSSSTIASATGNLVPAFTFLMAWVMGLEKVQMKSLRSIAKVIGTILCVAGAVAMALIKGPKLLNSQFIPTNGLLLILGKENSDNLDSNWMLGVILLIASAICWSFWLILQVTLSADCPDHLCLTAWLCLFAAIQSGFATIFIEPNINSWKITSSLELISCLCTGFSSAVSFFGQAWCISHRGPLFSAMFNPLCTVIVTIFASTFMKEEMYTGSFVGSLAVIFGLYVVLWGKSKDKKEENISVDEEPVKQHNIQETTITIQDSNSDLITNCKIDLEEPLLTKISTNNEDDK
ncbi:WAT1-related protein At4g30420-like isoform X1 [Solanum stenotomum]|uniref:WAT1-related protein At4g30420-like isoform X1 n=1 Tax=Solanum stenotomum TaxID=172797 RepID=UPI0020D0C92C|nr:WAT1-related protein At4g30420-like isoform X1 [Solanum stenotomum]